MREIADERLERRRVDQFLFPRREGDQHPRVADSPRGPGEQVEGPGIGPLHVLEREGERPLAGKPCECREDCGEQARPVATGRRIGVDHAGVGAREKPVDLPSRRRSGAEDAVQIGRHDRPVEGGRPRREGHGALDFVAAPEEHAPAPGEPVRHELLEHARLSASGLRQQQDGPAAPGPRRVGDGGETGQLHAASDERRIFFPGAGPWRRRGRRLDGHRAIRHDPEQGPVEMAGLGLGLCAKISPKHLHERLVLVQSRGASPLIDVQTHQGTVNGLLDRVQIEEAERGADARSRRPRADVIREEATERVHRHLAEAVPLAPDPLVEGLLVHVEAVEEVADVQACRLVERRWITGRGQALERGDVHGEGVETQTDGVSLDEDPGDQSTQEGQTLPQAVARFGIRASAPEERRELVSFVTTTGGEREEGEQRTGLAGRNVSFRAVGEVQPERSEQGQMRNRHVRSCPSDLSVSFKTTSRTGPSDSFTPSCPPR